MNLSRRLDTETITELTEVQLERWPDAKRNFDDLQKCRRKAISLGAMQGAAQLNPARIRSTAAAVDKKSVEARPCFLCSANRPAQQITISWLEGWELLVNPFPILPVHFTIASTTHRPQDRIPLEMAAMAEMAPSLAFFFNGAKAGASAPDHMHVQAVLSSELPLLRFVESAHSLSMGRIIDSAKFDRDLPFQFISAIITPDNEGMALLAKIPRIAGMAEDSEVPDPGLVNAFFWIAADGMLRIIVIPRRAHRPKCYFADGDNQMLISPGAIDMAGLIITPREEDFDKLNSELIWQIYSEVAFKEKLPTQILQCAGIPTKSH